MKRQRGFGLIIYAVMALAILGALAGLYALVDNSWETSAGIEKGEANITAKWEKENREAEVEAKKQRRASELLAAELARQLIVAEGDAEDYARQLEQERAKRKREGRPLAFADCSKPNQTGGTENATPNKTDVTLTLRLSWDFVREWDAGHTDQTGKPVFGIQPGGAAPGEQANSASPLTLDDALSNHNSESKLCSGDRRRLNALTNKIRKLQESWQQ